MILINLNELMVSLCGIKYGDGYSIDELYADTMMKFTMFKISWLNEEYPYYVEKGLVEKLDLDI